MPFFFVNLNVLSPGGNARAERFFLSGETGYGFIIHAAGGLVKAAPGVRGTNCGMFTNFRLIFLRFGKAIPRVFG